MQNKFWVTLFTIVISALSLFYLSFTFVGQNMDKKAREFAMDDNGIVNYDSLQKFQDSLWKKPVYDLGFVSYTLQEVKKREISLGLDLRGGMHVTLEVSPEDILRALAGTNKKAAGFEEAIAEAKAAQLESQDKFTTLFFDALEEKNVDLKSIFATAANRDNINFDSSPEEVQKAIEKEVDSAIDRVEQIIKSRIDQFGVTQPLIQPIEGTGRIQVELPGVDNPRRVRELLQGVAQLEFIEVYPGNEAFTWMSNINTMLYEKEKAEKELATVADSLNLAANDTTASDSTKLQEPQVSGLFKVLSTQRDGSGGINFIVASEDKDKVDEYLARADVQALIPKNTRFAWGVKAEDYFQGDVDLFRLYALKTGRDNKPSLAGDVVVDARLSNDRLGRPSVSMRMNPQGAKTWRKLTRDLSSKQPQGQVAVVLDGRVYSAPNVNTEIADGSSEISGSFTTEEAKDLANVLKTGKLPAPTRIVEEAVVGPTLGLAAQDSGLYSIIAGLVIVVLFMIGYYAKGGLIANIALLFNIFFIFGVLASPDLGASLTLPGLAGIVLTIGMSIDANVLIFERIREELKIDSNLMRAINQGYEKAFWTIFDANVTTFLTAIFLFTFGSGPIKGFATVLMIGIACSFFSAVYITRVAIMIMTQNGKKSNVSFATPFTKGLLSGVNIDFLGKRKMAYIGSAIVIIIGWSLIAMQGLNLGVDFDGGRSYQVKFGKDVEVTSTKSALSDIFANSSLEVKTFGDDQTLKITTNYKVADEGAEVDEEVQNLLVQGLEKHTGAKFLEKDKAELTADEFTIPFTAKVGATIADDIASASRTAVLFSLAAIFFYIWVRFRKWRFGLGAVAALLHDTLMVFSVFAIARALGIAYEIDQVFVAAMLTIIGYSINDTVVVFDRVREYLNLRPSQDVTKTFNESINGTLNRTLVTSITTLIVALVLFTFGGEALRGFSFAMLVGILFGTYSSIFIATPIVYDTRNIGSKKSETVVDAKSKATA